MCTHLIIYCAICYFAYVLHVTIQEFISSDQAIALTNSLSLLSRVEEKIKEKINE